MSKFQVNELVILKITDPEDRVLNDQINRRWSCGFGRYN